VPLLVRHPNTPPGAIQAIDAELLRVPGGALASFSVIGEIASLVVPPTAIAERTDELWKTTCFELFVAGDSPSYREFNFSPSGAWAAYDFDAYRSSMRNANAQVEIEISKTTKNMKLIAKIESDIGNPANVGLTAVIEEVDGSIRYWSTAFAPGKPDFHAAAVRSLLFDGVSAE
jgi:hypothetical protein